MNMNAIPGTTPIEIARRKEAMASADALASSGELREAAVRFAEWIEAHGYASYDPYDVWGTEYGKLARRLYYAKHPAGVVMTAPVILMEVVLPGLRRLFVKKERYPTADAQVALAFLNLYEAGMQDGREAGKWLQKARGLATELLTHSIPGYHGYCWGYPFDWQNLNGLMRKGTPHITATPYCYELFTRFFDLTGDSSSLGVAASIARFVSEDLADTPTGNDSAASSYTPDDHGKVVNASAYRAFVLFDAARRFENEDYTQKAWRNLRFILESQRQDGAWLYAIDNPGEGFIDHFHTCFVLKNLYKINRQLHSAAVREALHRGYAWYRRELFDERDSPKSFAVAPRLQIVQLEMYNFAEAINLGALLRNEIPEAQVLARTLARRLIRKYQVPAGYWVTRIYLGGIRHTTPFLRWPQSQLFHAVTNLLLATGGGWDESSGKVGR
jgi:hypothetical protein